MALIKGELAYEVVWLKLYDLCVPQDFIEESAENLKIIVDSNFDILAIYLDKHACSARGVIDESRWRIFNDPPLSQTVYQKIQSLILEEEFDRLCN